MISLNIRLMHYQQRFARGLILLFGMTSIALLCSFKARATVNDALSFAYQAAQHYHKNYEIRRDLWGGDLGIGEKKAIKAQLFKGNDYWFWVGSDIPHSDLSVHIYNDQGELAEDDSYHHIYKHYSSAKAHIIPDASGTYYAIVEVTKSPKERTPWALVYGYKDTKKK